MHLLTKLGMLATSLMVPLAVTAVPPGAAAADPSGALGVDVLNINGSGCKQGTTAVAMSPDNAAFTVTYSEYLAQVGPGAKKTDASKDCRLNLRLGAAAGYTYAIEKVDYRGFVDLADGAVATQHASYHFHGSKTTASIAHAFTGPLLDDWQVTDTTNADALLYGPCGTAVNLDVDTELTVSAGTQQAAATTNLITMDSADGTIRTTYHLAWQRCG